MALPKFTGDSISVKMKTGLVVSAILTAAGWMGTQAWTEYTAMKAQIQATAAQTHDQAITLQQLTKDTSEMKQDIRDVRNYFLPTRLTRVEP